MGHTAGTLRKIGIYVILRNNWHIDVPWNISKIFYWISFFFCSTHGFDIELYDVLYHILCKLYILRIGVLDWHIHCAWVCHEIIKIVEHSLAHLGSCKCFDEVENVSGFFNWYRILFCIFEICTISLFSFGWWYTLMKNKHQISLSAFLSVALSFFLSVCPSVPFTSFSLCFHHGIIMKFSLWLPMTEVMSMQKFKVRGHKSRL